MDSVTGCSLSHSIIWFCVQFLGHGGADNIFGLLWHDGSWWAECVLWRVDHGSSSRGKWFMVVLETNWQHIQHCFIITSRIDVDFFAYTAAMRQNIFWLHWHYSCYLNTTGNTISRIVPVSKGWFISALWCGVIAHCCNGASWLKVLNALNWLKYGEASGNGLTWDKIFH